MATVEHVDRTIGPAAATELLYRRHGSRVLRYCLRCLRRPADAEDALQQTFLQAHRALGRGVEPAAEVTWLLTIARNVCLTRIDALRRRARVEFAEDPSILAASAGADDARPELSPEIVQALARLPQRQRQVLFLREWQELSYAEIATALGTSESAVETLLFRARNALAAQLGTPRRRRRGFDLAALLGGWGRSVAGVALPKLAAGAAAVVAVTAAGVATTGSASQPARHGFVLAGASAPAASHVHAARPVRVTPRSHRHRSVAPAAVRRVRPVSTVVPASPATTVSPAPVAEPAPVAKAAASPQAGLVSSAVAVVTRPVPAASRVPAPPLDAVVTSTLAPVVAPVVAPVAAAADATVDATTQTAAAVVPAATATVDQAAHAAAGTTQAASATVSTTVSRVLPGR